MEVWKRYIYNYDVSNMGRVRNCLTGHILKQSVFENGYHVCVVSCGSRSEKVAIRVHIAVAKLFVDNPFNFPEVNHKDGNKDNNRASNLEWCTHSYNIKHAIEHDLLKILCGEDCKTSKLKQRDVDYIRANYIPRDRQYGARALARRFNVHHSVVERIVNNTAWRG